MNRLKFIQTATILIVIFVGLGVIYMRRDTHDKDLTITIDPIHQAIRKTNEVLIRKKNVSFPPSKKRKQEILQLNTNVLSVITENNSGPITFSAISSNFIMAACSNSPDSVELCAFLKLRKTPWNFTDSDWNRIIEILSDTDKTTMEVFYHTILDKILHGSNPSSQQNVDQTADALLRLAGAVPNQTDSLTFETIAASMVALSDKERAIQMLDETTQEMKECENFDSSIYIMACGQKISYMAMEKKYEEAENEYNELFSQKPSDLTDEKWNMKKYFIWYDLMAQYCRMKDNDEIRNKGIAALKELTNNKQAPQIMRSLAKDELKRVTCWK